MITMSRRIIYKTLSILYLIYLSSSVVEALKYLPKPRQTPNPCFNHNMGEFVKNPENCKLFFWCGENNEAIIASCPTTMLFNDDTKLCDNPENVQCESTVSNPLPIPTTPTPLPETFSNTDEYCYNLYLLQPSSNALIFLTHSTNCQRYYMCYHGQALLQECGNNLHWNSQIAKCDIPSNANCMLRDDSNSLEILTTLDEPIWGNGIKCPLYGEHIFPHVKRCDFFIYCVKGNAILQQCPFYHYFDVESARCKVRSSAVCIKDLNVRFRKNKINQ